MSASSSLLLARVILGLGALTLAALGAAFLAAPDTMAALIELELATPLARSDVRAVYGGLELGLALLQLTWLRSAETVRRGVQLHLAIWGGLAFGRGIGLLCSEDPAASGIGLFGTELAGLGLGVVAWYAMRRSAP